MTEGRKTFMAINTKDKLFIAGVFVFGFITATVLIYTFDNFSKDEEIAAFETELSLTRKTDKDRIIVKNQQSDELESWQTYRNEEFGFELSFPPRWQGVKIEQVPDQDYNGDQINIILEDNLLCYIGIYSEEEWKNIKDTALINIPVLLTNKDGVSYTWSCGHDDFGYKNFEDYNNATQEGNFEDINNNLIMGPFQEFQHKILPAFKFIK